MSRNFVWAKLQLKLYGFSVGVVETCEKTSKKVRIRFQAEDLKLCEQTFDLEVINNSAHQLFVYGHTAETTMHVVYGNEVCVPFSQKHNFWNGKDNDTKTHPTDGYI